MQLSRTTYLLCGLGQVGDLSEPCIEYLPQKGAWKIEIKHANCLAQYRQQLYNNGSNHSSSNSGLKWKQLSIHFKKFLTSWAREGSNGSWPSSQSLGGPHLVPCPHQDFSIPLLWFSCLWKAGCSPAPRRHSTEEGTQTIALGKNFQNFPCLGGEGRGLRVPIIWKA